MNQITDEADNGTRCSRSGRTDPGGKLTARLDVPISEEMLDAIVFMATARNKPKAEFVREALERLLFGEFDVIRRRMAVLDGEVHPMNRRGMTE